MENKKIKISIIVAVLIVVFVLAYVAVAHKLFRQNVLNSTNQKNEQIVETEASRVGCDSYAVDQDAYNDAIEKNNIKICDCIKESTFKSKCEKMTTDLNLYNTAILQLNIDSCNNISENSIKSACLNVLQGRDKSKETDNEPVRINLNDSDATINEYERLIAQDKNDVASRLSLASEYATKGLKDKNDLDSYMKKALTLIQEAKNIDPKNIRISKMEARIYFMNKDYAKAEEVMNEAISADSNCASCYKILAGVMFVQSKYDQALEKTLLGIDLIGKDTTLIVGETDELKRSLYYLATTIYAEKGDTVNSDKYKNLEDKK